MPPLPKGMGTTHSVVEGFNRRPVDNTVGVGVPDDPIKKGSEIYEKENISYACDSIDAAFDYADSVSLRECACTFIPQHYGRL